MPPAIDLARRYAEALAALRAVHVFDSWLGRHWHDRCPVAGNGPASFTPLSAHEGITWFEVEEGETVLGYLPGEAGCFCIPQSASLPDFPFAAEARAVPYGQDIVLSAAMREERYPPERHGNDL